MVTAIFVINSKNLKLLFVTNIKTVKLINVKQLLFVTTPFSLWLIV